MTVRDGWRFRAAHRIHRPLEQVLRSALGRPGSFLALALVVAATAVGLVAMHSLTGAAGQHEHASAHAPSAEIADFAAAPDPGGNAAGCEDCGHHAAMAGALCSLALIALAVVLLVRPTGLVAMSRAPWMHARSVLPVLPRAARSLQELGLSRT